MKQSSWNLDFIYRCKALGQGKDQAKVEFLREERFPFPLRYLVNETLRNQLQDALVLCDSVAFQLRGALLTGWLLSLPGQTG